MPGLMLHGFLYALPTSALPTAACAGSASDGDDDGSWATPTVSGNYNRSGASEKAGDGLATQVSKGCPTPGASDGTKAPKCFARGNPSLPEAVKWPTPTASNPNDGEDPVSWEARRQRNLARGVNGNGQGLPLGMAVKGSAWPTPVASDHRSGLAGEKTLERNARPLREVASNPVLWPTPRATSETGGGSGLDGGSGSRAMMDKVLTPEERAAMGGGNGSGQLNPLWVELLMGWPLGWTSELRCGGCWPGWPMGMGPDQHGYEPPRTVPLKIFPTGERAARLKMLGNGVVPQQAEGAFSILLGFAKVHP